MARTPARIEKLTYQLHRHCVLCGGPIADQETAEACRAHRVPTAAVQVATNHVPDQPLEVFELTHNMVTPDGNRRWAGRGEDGRTVVWEERAAANGRGA